MAGILRGTAFPISIEDGLRAVAIADAAYRSAERRGGGRGGRRILWRALIAPGSGIFGRERYTLQFLAPSDV